MKLSVAIKALITITLTLGGCVVQTETDDFGQVSSELANSNSSHRTVDSGHFSGKLKSNNGKSKKDNNTVPTPITGTLSVAVDHADASFIVLSVDMQTIADVDAFSCPLENGFYTCDIVIPIGAYLIEFDDVSGYNTPNDIMVNLSEVGSDVFGTYTVPGPPTGTLTVAMNNVDGGFAVLNVNEQMIVTKSAAECPLQNGYYACNITLPTGLYMVGFDDVSGFVTPSNIAVQLNETGTTVYGTY